MGQAADAHSSVSVEPGKKVFVNFKVCNYTDKKWE